MYELEKQVPVEVLERDKFKPDKKFSDLLKILTDADKKAWRCSNPIMASIEYMSYHHPFQAENYPMPGEDGKSSEHQGFYLNAREWLERLQPEVDFDHLISFQDKFGSDQLADLDPKMADAIYEVAETLIVKDPDNNGCLLNMLTPENYEELDSPKKKLAAFLLLRERMSSLVAGIETVLLEKAMDLKMDASNIEDLAKTYEELKRNGAEFRELDAKYLESNIGEQKVIDFLNELYQNPLITWAGNFVEESNHIRDKFIDNSEDEQVIETSELGRLINIQFESLGYDNECEEIRARRRDESLPPRLSKYGKKWSRDLYTKCKDAGYTNGEILKEVSIKSKEIKNGEQKKNQKLIIQSLYGISNWEGNREARREIKDGRGKNWEKMGLSQFEINYLTEMALSGKKSETIIGRVNQEARLLQKEISLSIEKKFIKAEKKQKSRIGKRLKELFSNPSFN